MNQITIEEHAVEGHRSQFQRHPGQHGGTAMNHPVHCRYGKPARALLLTFMLCASLTAKMAEADTPDGGMNWFFTPYVWMSDTSIKASINDRTIAEGEIEFPDMIDKVEAAFQGHLEGYWEHFGFFADMTYISAQDDSGHDGISVDAEVDTGIVELAAVYNIPGKGLDGLSLFAAGRPETGVWQLAVRPPGTGSQVQVKSVSQFYRQWPSTWRLRPESSLGVIQRPVSGYHHLGRVRQPRYLRRQSRLWGDYGYRVGLLS
jgi:hypothetical protein